MLLEAGQGLVNVAKVIGSDGKDDLLLSLDRSKISTVGKEALGIFLRKLQVIYSSFFRLMIVFLHNFDVSLINQRFTSRPAI